MNQALTRAVRAAVLLLPIASWPSVIAARCSVLKRSTLDCKIDGHSPVGIVLALSGHAINFVLDQLLRVGNAVGQTTNDEDLVVTRTDSCILVQFDVAAALLLEGTNRFAATSNDCSSLVGRHRHAYKFFAFAQSIVLVISCILDDLVNEF